MHYVAATGPEFAVNTQIKKLYFNSLCSSYGSWVCGKHANKEIIFQFIMQQVRVLSLT